MVNRTPNFNLYKLDTSTDGNLTFNIDQVLNDNLDVIDTNLKKALRLDNNNDYDAGGNDLTNVGNLIYGGTSQLSPVGSQSKSYSLATTGWHRIAETNAGDSSILNEAFLSIVCGGNSRALAHISNTNRTLSVGNSLTVNQLSASLNNSVNVISGLRLVYHPSAGKTYLEIYKEGGSVSGVAVQAFNNVNWNFYDNAVAGSIPTGYATKELWFTPGISSNANIRLADGASTSGVYMYASGSELAINQFRNRIVSIEKDLVAVSTWETIYTFNFTGSKLPAALITARVGTSDRTIMTFVGGIMGNTLYSLSGVVPAQIRLLNNNELQLMQSNAGWNSYGLTCRVMIMQCTHT